MHLLLQNLTILGQPFLEEHNVAKKKEKQNCPYVPDAGQHTNFAGANN
jgi:hypothetical protein